ncbi:MAG TPA: hypothetical protein DCZ72_15395 [Armatimonadetes bacterium]|nr:hypothetical protein [Armatimonadota bacterium]
MEAEGVVIVRCIHCGTDNELDETAQARGKFRCRQCGLVGDIDVFTGQDHRPADPRDDNRPTAVNEPIANRLAEERAGTVTCGLVALGVALVVLGVLLA